MNHDALPSRTVRAKPDFDECMARIYAWYEQEVTDRVPVRFHHHNIEYERSRVIEGEWETVEDRWRDVEFQVKTFLDSLEGVTFAGETFPVFWPNLSAVVYNLFLGQTAEFDDATAWTRPCIDDLENLLDDEGRIDVAENVANALIQRYPDLVGIAGFDGSSGGGICPAVKNAGKAGAIKVAINDLIPAHIEFLKDGSAQYVSGQKRNIFGPLALQVLYDIKNQDYAFTSSIESDAKFGIYQAPDKIDTGFLDVTTESVAEFEKAQQ